MLHKIKSTLEKLETNKDEKDTRPPPDDEFRLINWIDKFLPEDYRGIIYLVVYSFSDKFWDTELELRLRDRYRIWKIF